MEQTVQSYRQLRGALVAEGVSIREIARRAGCSDAWVKKVLCREVSAGAARGEAARAVLREAAAVLGYNPLEAAANEGDAA